MMESIPQTLERVGLIPVLRARNEKQALEIVQAMMNSGVTVVEVTMTVPGAVNVLKALKKEHGDKLLLGSGTVITGDEAQATIEAGAEFVVSPSFHPEVVEHTKKLGKLSIPGALTPTEVVAAYRSGADYVKIFPCSALGGATYLKSLLAPFPHIPLIPTGGVTLATAESFLQAGARALGVGSDLVNLTAVDEGHPEKITQVAAAYLQIVAAFRAKRSASA